MRIWAQVHALNLTLFFSVLFGMMESTYKKIDVR